VEDMKEVEMIVKMKLSNHGLLGEIYTKGSTKLEGNRGIKSLPPLEISSG
jgi:hypothetical protein